MASYPAAGIARGISSIANRMDSSSLTGRSVGAVVKFLKFRTAEGTSSLHCSGVLEFLYGVSSLTGGSFVPLALRKRIHVSTLHFGMSRAIGSLRGSIFSRSWSVKASSNSSMCLRTDSLSASSITIMPVEVFLAFRARHFFTKRGKFFLTQCSAAPCAEGDRSISISSLRIPDKRRNRYRNCCCNRSSTRAKMRDGLLILPSPRN